MFSNIKLNGLFLMRINVIKKKKQNWSWHFWKCFSIIFFNSVKINTCLRTLQLFLYQEWLLFYFSYFAFVYDKKEYISFPRIHPHKWYLKINICLHHKNSNFHYILWVKLLFLCSSISSVNYKYLFCTTFIAKLMYY